MTAAGRIAGWEAELLLDQWIVSILNRMYGVLTSGAGSSSGNEPAAPEGGAVAASPPTEPAGEIDLDVEPAELPVDGASPETADAAFLMSVLDGFEPETDLELDATTGGGQALVQLSLDELDYALTGAAEGLLVQGAVNASVETARAEAVDPAAGELMEAFVAGLDDDDDGSDTSFGGL